MNPSKPTTIEEYIASFPKDTQQTLNELRKLVVATVPNCIESISYGMPAYKLNGKPMIYFAAFKHHIGIYATPITHEAFADELSAYKQGKGSVQFPLNQAFPYELVKKMIIYKMKHL